MKKCFFSLLLAAIIFVPFTISAQVTIGSGAEPSQWSLLDLDNSERLYREEQPKALHLPRMTTDERNALVAPVSEGGERRELERGLMIFNTSNDCLEFWSGTDWISLCVDALHYLYVTPDEWEFASSIDDAHTFTVSTSLTGDIEVTGLPAWANDITINQTARTFTITTTQQNPNLFVAPRNATITVTVGSMSQQVIISQRGLVWAQTNVDATQLSGFAPLPGDFGSYFQWNRSRAWNNGTDVEYWSTFTWGTGSWQPLPAGMWDTSREPGDIWDPARDPCPSGWRLPTEIEATALVNASDIGAGGFRGQWLTAAQAGNLGLGSNPGHLFGTGINPIPDAFEPTTMIFMPATGFRRTQEGNLSRQGEWVFSWTSVTMTAGTAWSLLVNPTTQEVGIRWFNKESGFTVRCVQ